MVAMDMTTDLATPTAGSSIPASKRQSSNCENIQVSPDHEKKTARKQDIPLDEERCHGVDETLGYGKEEAIGPCENPNSDGDAKREGIAMEGQDQFQVDHNDADIITENFNFHGNQAEPPIRRQDSFDDATKDKSIEAKQIQHKNIKDYQEREEGETIEIVKQANSSVSKSQDADEFGQEVLATTDGDSVSSTESPTSEAKDAFELVEEQMEEHYGTSQGSFGTMSEIGTQMHSVSINDFSTEEVVEAVNFEMPPLFSHLEYDSIDQSQSQGTVEANEETSACHQVKPANKDIDKEALNSSESSDQSKNVRLETPKKNCDTESEQEELVRTKGNSVSSTVSPTNALGDATVSLQENDSIGRSQSMEGNEEAPVFQQMKPEINHMDKKAKDSSDPLKNAGVETPKKDDEGESDPEALARTEGNSVSSTVSLTGEPTHVTDPPSIQSVGPHKDAVSERNGFIHDIAHTKKQEDYQHVVDRQSDEPKSGFRLELSSANFTIYKDVGSGQTSTNKSDGTSSRSFPAVLAAQSIEPTTNALDLKLEIDIDMMVQSFVDFLEKENHKQLWGDKGVQRRVHESQAQDCHCEASKCIDPAVQPEGRSTKEEEFFLPASNGSEGRTSMSQEGHHELNTTRRIFCEAKVVGSANSGRQPSSQNAHDTDENLKQTDNQQSTTSRQHTSVMAPALKAKPTTESDTSKDSQLSIDAQRQYENSAGIGIFGDRRASFLDDTTETPSKDMETSLEVDYSSDSLSSTRHSARRSSSIKSICEKFEHGSRSNFNASGLSVDLQKFYMNQKAQSVTYQQKKKEAFGLYHGAEEAPGNALGEIDQTRRCSSVACSRESFEARQGQVFVFVIHEEKGLLVRRTASGSSATRSYEVPGGVLNESDFVAAERDCDIACERHLRVSASRIGAARALYSVTGIDVRRSLNRLIPINVPKDLSDEWEEKPIAQSRPKEWKVYFFLYLTEKDLQEGILPIFVGRTKVASFVPNPRSANKYADAFFEKDPAAAVMLLGSMDSGVVEALILAIETNSSLDNDNAMLLELKSLTSTAPDDDDDDNNAEDGATEVGTGHNEESKTGELMAKVTQSEEEFRRHGDSGDSGCELAPFESVACVNNGFDFTKGTTDGDELKVENLSPEEENPSEEDGGTHALGNERLTANDEDEKPLGHDKDGSLLSEGTLQGGEEELIGENQTPEEDEKLFGCDNYGSPFSEGTVQGGEKQQSAGNETPDEDEKPFGLDNNGSPLSEGTVQGREKEQSASNQTPDEDEKPIGRDNYGSPFSEGTVEGGEKQQSAANATPDEDEKPFGQDNNGSRLGEGTLQGGEEQLIAANQTPDEDEKPFGRNNYGSLFSEGRVQGGEKQQSAANETPDEDEKPFGQDKDGSPLGEGTIQGGEKKQSAAKETPDEDEKPFGQDNNGSPLSEGTLQGGEEQLIAANKTPEEGENQCEELEGSHVEDNEGSNTTKDNSSVCPDKGAESTAVDLVSYIEDYWGSKVDRLKDIHTLLSFLSSREVPSFDGDEVIQVKKELDLVRQQKTKSDGSQGQPEGEGDLLHQLFAMKTVLRENSRMFDSMKKLQTLHNAVSKVTAGSGNDSFEDESLTEEVMSDLDNVISDLESHIGSFIGEEKKQEKTPEKSNTNQKLEEGQGQGQGHVDASQLQPDGECFNSSQSADDSLEGRRAIAGGEIYPSSRWELLEENPTCRLRNKIVLADQEEVEVVAVILKIHEEQDPSAFDSSLCVLNNEKPSALKRNGQVVDHAKKLKVKFLLRNDSSTTAHNSSDSRDGVDEVCCCVTCWE